MELAQIISKANKYIKEELGLDPPTAEIKEGGRTYSYYDPKVNIVYLEKNADEIDLFHEYYGHALFADQSFIGRKQFSLEKQIKMSERELQLPHNTKFLFRKGEDFKLEKNSNYNKDGYEYIAYFKLGDKETEAYLDLIDEALALHQEIEPAHEAFAAWMEVMLAETLAIENKKIKKRLQIFEKCCPYNQIKADEERLGKISLLYELGFPKSSDIKIVKKFTEENLGDLSQFSFIILYGSGQRDIDIMAIGGEIPRKTVYTTHFDSLIYSGQEFYTRLQAFDIEATDPLLTGKLIKGDEAEFSKLKHMVKSNEPHQFSIEYALKKSLDAFNCALSFFNENQADARREIILKEDINKAADIILNNKHVNFSGDNLLSCLNNISYSLSYMLSAVHYKEKNNAVTFKGLLSNNILKSLTDYIKLIQNEKEKVSEEKTEDFFDLARKELPNLLNKL